MILARVQTRVPGFDPDRFWAEAPGLEAWQAMVDKYAALAELARADPDQRGPKLRHASRRWPGSLREAELIGPERVEQRGAAAGLGLLEPDRSRASWTDASAHAVIGWASLHPLLEDQRRFRASGSGRDSQAFARWLASGEPNPRWPSPERVAEVVGPKLRVRSAYLWLAALAGLDLPSLNAALLDRAGHWDRRPDDPSWAHGGPFV